MTIAAIAFNYRELEDAGFTKQQTDVLIRLVDAASPNEDIIKNEIDLSESRIEKAMKEMELRLIKEIHAIDKNLGERIHGVEKNLSFINRIGGFIISIASLATIIFGFFHAHISIS